VVIAVLLLGALLAPYIARYDPTAPHFELRLRPRSTGFPFGTDFFGRDILSRLLCGGRISLVGEAGRPAGSGAASARPAGPAGPILAGTDPRTAPGSGPVGDPFGRWRWNPGTQIVSGAVRLTSVGLSQMSAESGTVHLQQARRVSTIPGMAIFLSVMGFNVLGDGLRDALDPRLH